MNITNTEIYGIKHAMRGMRNPFESHSKSDTVNEIIGKNDLELAQKLVLGGSEHSKFMRQIKVWADLDVTRYIWSELDTYHYNNKNSESTMHKLFRLDREISVDDFYTEGMGFEDRHILNQTIIYLNDIRKDWINSGKKFEHVRRAKRLLPETFLQKRTMDTNFAELRNIYFQRKNHRLKDEWGIITEWIESLPYAKELITLEKEKY